MQNVFNELKKSFLYIFKIQICFWLAYLVLAGLNLFIVIICGVILMTIILFIIYFKHINQIIDKNKFHRLRFDIISFVIWIVLSIIIGIVLDKFLVGTYNIAYILGILVFCTIAILIEIVNIILFIFTRKKK